MPNPATRLAALLNRLRQSQGAGLFLSAIEQRDMNALASLHESGTITLIGGPGEDTTVLLAAVSPPAN